MSLVIKDRISETTTTSGTSDLVLGGATPGYQSFAVIGDTNTVYYCITDGNSWEVGLGTYSTTGPTLARTTVYSNSLGTTAKISLTVGVKNVFAVYPAEGAVTVNIPTATIQVPSGGVLPVANGGTGSNTATFSGANITSINANNVSSGVLAVAQGGTGSATATFSGANITSLNASSISSGTIGNAYTTASSANGANTIVSRDANGDFSARIVTATTFSGSGASITSINASNISAGTIGNAYTTAASANGASTIVARDALGAFSAGIITADGSALTSLNASSISSGTLANARTTAASANGASTIVARDASGAFSAGTITATLTGTASNATVLQTARAIYGNNFDGSAALTQVIASTYGGTGNGFTKFSGPTTAEKTFTLPDASATILTSNTAVTVAQGGTGQTTYTNGQLLIGNTTGNTLTKATLTAGSGITITNGTGSITIASSGAVYDATTSSTGYFQVSQGTTAQRPGSPANGMIRYNTTNSELEVYQSGAWTTYVTQAVGNYSVEYLVVAGGGSGGGATGQYTGGGGGAGGYRTGTKTVSIGVAYTVTVGAGGTGNTGSGSVGNNSVFDVTSSGGGNGGSSGGAGGSGGSGGGGSHPSGGAGSGTAGQGNNGGSCASSGGVYGSAGGGGAGAVGGNGSTASAGAGGNGTAWSNGTTYAGGGGGSTYNTTSGGAGGSGGGGAGGTTGNGSAGSANTGGGGGGARGDNSSYTGGSGGSGVVIIRYAGGQRGTGGTVTSSGGYTYHTFNSSGTFTG